MDLKNQQAAIVKKVLERAAAELAEELALVEEIDEDVRLADEREGWKAKVWAQEKAYAALKEEHAFLKDNYAQLSQQNAEKEQASKDKEMAFTNKIVFLQQSLQNANNINVQACKQLVMARERITQLEAELVAAKREHVMERARLSLMMTLNAAKYVPK